MYAQLLLLLAATAPFAARAYTFKGYIPLDGLLSNITLSPSSRIVLDHSSKYALIRQDGTFELFDFSEGTHVLTPQIPDYVFPSYLLTLITSAPSTPSDTPLEDLTSSTPAQTLTPHIQILHPGKSPLSTSSPSIPYPLALRPLGKENYYTPRGGVDVLGMLKSPIVLMMLLSGVMMYAMPKMMASMDADPEMKKEMMEARRRMTGMQSGLTGSLSSMLGGGEPAGTPVPGPRADSPASAAAAAGQARGGGGGRGNGGAQRRRGK